MTSPTAANHEPETTPAAPAEMALVRGLLEKSEPAWREFHARYGRLVCRCITKVTSRFRRYTSDDDLREIYATFFMQLLANDMYKLRMYAPERGANLSSWIGRLAANCAHDYVRASRRRALRERAAVEQSEIERSAPPWLDEQVDSRRRLRFVESLLADFPPKDREFLNLYFGEGLEPDEIAERMRISRRTVYSKKNKIQNRLEAILSEGRVAA
jgi:RNA polymerase sigma-70 factor (ECF subfamily)